MINETTNTQNYINYLNEKCSKMVIQDNKLQKITNNEIIIPKYDCYLSLLKYNYNINTLKKFSKHYKLKTRCNKPELLKNLFTFLYLSYNVVKIQKLGRGYLTRKYIKCHGPAFLNRKLCTNNSDFLTMDDINSIPFSQFFSYKDNDGFIYGFDIISLINLIDKSNGLIKNPYNRNDISKEIILNLEKLINLSRLLRIDVITEIKDVLNEVSSVKSLELRVVSLFQKMDELGHYTNYMWFMNLNAQQLINLLKEIIDVWNYRAPLSINIKRKICPPNGNPFTGVNIHNMHNVLNNLHDIRKIVLEVIENLVFNGIDKDSKCLGTYYVLGCLTLVNLDVANTLPWLFQAFNYM
jgi:hypothetical protein